MQTEESTTARHSASGRLPAFAPGHLFELADHFNSDRNGEYMLTTVHHSVAQEFGRGGSNTYFNSFSAARTVRPFRPPLVTPKPIVQGPQTALVVGKDDRGKIDPAQSDDDIDVDELGRVLVKFHWDRSGPNAKRDSQKKHESSCRVRVSQEWAGRNWGAVFWPRIGQEVIVEFLEGDPDHPIITGRVYNGKFKPPYDLPANKTQSGIKTRSTPNGTPDNFNEIRFEDKKGKEEIAIHAERSFSTSVEADESHSVGGQRSTTIQKDDTSSVKGKQRSEVDKNSELAIAHGNRLVTVSTGNYYADVPTKEFHVHAKEFWAITDTKAHLKAAAAEVMVQPSEIKLLLGGSTIVVTSSGIQITSSGPVEVKGATIKLNC
jgi:type VI secretion system secreted protein VgrG